MKKYIKPNALLSLCREDIEIFGQPGDAMEWIARLVDECPPAENLVHIQYAPGTNVWTPSGKHGVIESLYIGRRGVQRIFARMDDGSKMNCSPKGIGKDIMARNPENLRSEPI